MQIFPIGIIRSPFTELDEMPIQPSGARGIEGRIELQPELVEGLADLEGFSHIIVLYRFHRVSRTRMTVTAFLDPKPHGVFATRAPTRSNHIGLSVLALKGIRANILDVENVDILDGTPLLDIKPYVPAFDQPDDVRTGWLEKVGDRSRTTRSDKRFC